MAKYTSSQEFLDNENDFRNSNRNFEKSKRKRITYSLVEKKPFHYPYHLEKEFESLLSIGE